MGQEYPLELREEAAGLYIEGGMTYEAVAAETGVSKTQIVRWASEGEWRARRAEYRAALSGIQRDTVHLRQSLVKKAMESLDPQDIYALTRLESLAVRNRPERAEAPVDRPAMFLESLQFIAETLKEIDPEALRVLGRHFDTLVNKFKQAMEA